MKKINLALLGLMLPMASFADSMTVPYESQLGPDCGWTIVNVVPDTRTWNPESNSSSYEGADGATAGVYYRYDSSNDADDWYISPAIHLEGGKEYKVKFWHKTNYDTESYALYMANSSGPESLLAGTVIYSNELTANNSWTHEVKMITPENDGDYYFGFHATSPKNHYNVYLTGFAVTDNVVLPAGVKDLAVTPGENKALAAELTWTLPTADADGSPLPEGISHDSVLVYRDGQLVATLAGDAVSWTDSEAEGLTAGFHDYGVALVLGGHQGKTVNVSSPYIGPLAAFNLPWNMNFETCESSDFDTFFTVFNALESESSGSHPLWYLSGYSSKYLYKYPARSKKDDWVVTPPLKADKAGFYRVVLNMASNSSNVVTNTHVYAAQGTSRDVFTDDKEIGVINAGSPKADYPLYVRVEEPGEFNIAVRELDTEGTEYVGAYIYSIGVEEWHESPLHVEGISSEIVDGAVILTWTNPSKSNIGSEISSLSKLEVRRNGAEEPLAVITDADKLAAGATVEFTDAAPAEGINSYTVLPYIGEYAAEGDPAVHYSAWVGDDTQALPYSCDFSDDTLYTLWKTADVDNDGTGWTFSKSGTALSLSRDEERESDDVLMTAPFDMTPGYYQVKFRMKNSAPDAVNVTAALMESDKTPSDYYASESVKVRTSGYAETYTQLFNVAAEGKYRFAIEYKGNGTTEAKKALTVTEVEVAFYPVVPQAAQDMSVVADPDGALKATISWTNPTGTNVEGVAATITKAHITRIYLTESSDVEEIMTVEEGLEPGAVTSVVDENVPKSGEYRYRVVLEGPGGKSDSASAVCSWIGKGLDVPYEPADLKKWTVINANGDWDRWDEYQVTWDTDYKTNKAHIESTTDAADDWLISFPLDIRHKVGYTISFDHWAYGTANTGTLEVYAGQGKTAEDMTVLIGTVNVDGVLEDNKKTAEFRVAGAKADEAEATDEENDITPVDPDTFESLLHIPAGATMIGIHANSKGNIFLANFKVGKFVLSGIDEIQSDELLGTLPADARDIRVYDLAGQEVARFATVEEIDFSGLTKGIYILNAISQKGKVSFKLTL